MRVLVIEDNQEVAHQIVEALEQEFLVVDIASDGEEGSFLDDTESYDTVILDLGLPKLDGLSLLQKWRENGKQVPILILTSRDTWPQKVTGLRVGADDYLSKPFKLEEVMAKVEALIRRSSGYANPLLKWGRLELEPNSTRVILDGAPVNLTALEYRALHCLMQKRGCVVSKTELSEHIYGQDLARDSNVIEVVINHLRRKLDPALIETRRGLGYQMKTGDRI